ncbi:MAG TPA: adenylyl-sulfate kinase [Tenuifilaceae bacterium]|nr:adenylyl-sulfate kinase [Tenuifilaceae bacterium]
MFKISPITVWLTGLPSSGKTTLGTLLVKSLKEKDVETVLLDGDDVRKLVCSDLGFSNNDRFENIRRAASIARLLNNQGVVVVCCFVSPLELMRQNAKKIIGDNLFFEVFIDADVETCSKRDVKGLYSKARQGIISDMTGISAPYEVPENPRLTIKTSETTVSEAFEILNKNVEIWLKE